MTEIEKPLKSAQMAEVVQKWYADFVAVEQVLLFELILAANYMDIKPLLDLTCATVASMIKGKTPEEIRKTFNIANDFSPEEEAQVMTKEEKGFWGENTQWIISEPASFAAAADGRLGVGLAFAASALAYYVLLC